MDLHITNYTCKGECSNCGQCCGDLLPISSKDIKTIEKYVKKHKIEPTARCIFSTYDNTCPFRDNANMKCKIYEVRPEICRIFKCDLDPRDIKRNRDLINKKYLSRSMRQIFFNDSGCIDFVNRYGFSIYDKNGKELKNNNNKIIHKK